MRYPVTKELDSILENCTQGHSISANTSACAYEPTKTHTCTFEKAIDNHDLKVQALSSDTLCHREVGLKASKTQYEFKFSIITGKIN